MKVKQKTPTTAVAIQDRHIPALPSEWATELATSAKAEAAREQPAAQTFSLRAGVLSYNGQAMPDNKVRGIVLASGVERAYYINKFDPGTVISPLCFALAEHTDDMKPHDNSYKKQGDDDGMCLGCPHNEWGSDENSPSGRGKACKEIRRLALLPEDALKDGVAKATIAMLKIPVTSVVNWAQYVHELAATASRPAWSVVTEISVIPDPRKQFQVKFQVTDAITSTEQLRELSNARVRAMQVIMAPYGMMTEEQYKEITEEKKKPAAKRKF